jgi:hypothetical protein
MRETSGRSSPSRRRLCPRARRSSQPQVVAEDLHPLDGLDLRVEVAHLEEVRPEKVVGQILRHFLVRVVTRVLSSRLDARADLPVQILDLAGRGPDDDPRVEEPCRRITCSTTAEPERSFSKRGRVADTNTMAFEETSNSSKCNGRLSARREAGIRS